MTKKLFNEITNFVNRNTGDSNTGNYNTGECNIGDSNTGDYNTGNFNAGNFNTGNFNAGYHNMGDYNTGDLNTGDSNAGDNNIGNNNIGSDNVGDFNIGNRNTGLFNTTLPKLRLFNKDSNWTLHDWYNSEAKKVLDKMPTIKWVELRYMSEEEKKDNPSSVITGGFLMKTSKGEKQKWWNELSLQEKMAVLNLPNFDADIFYKCTNIKIK